MTCDSTDGSKKVLIFKDSNGNYFAEPGYAVLKKAKDKPLKLKFKRVNADVTIVIHPHLQFSNPIFKLNKNQPEVVIEEKEPGSSNPGEYPYAIVPEESGRFIVGNSPPSMIIEPDDL